MPTSIQNQFASQLFVASTPLNKSRVVLTSVRDPRWQEVELEDGDAVAALVHVDGFDPVRVTACASVDLLHHLLSELIQNIAAPQLAILMLERNLNADHVCKENNVF